MHPMGMLGPTDPTVSNQFNPQHPADPNKRLGISVEEVTAYLALIKEDAGIQHQDELIQAVNLLASKVHPLALGNVKRSISQSRLMAEKLLALHMDESKDAHKISEIVDNLTSKSYYHGHPINRKEARNHVGLETVEDAPPDIEQYMWNLYKEFEREMRADQAFDPAMDFLSTYPQLPAGGQEITDVIETPIAFIESTDRTDRFQIGYRLAGKMDHDGVTKVTTIFCKRRWETD